MANNCLDPAEPTYASRSKQNIVYNAGIRTSVASVDGVSR
jgi:hypothetical protein